MSEIAQILVLGEAALSLGLAVFLRIGTAMVLLPAFGEHTIPVRVRLTIALAFVVIVAPAVSPAFDGLPTGLSIAPRLWLTEPIVGLAFGFGMRLAIMVLQMAGTMIAQSISLSQAFASSGAEPVPVVAHGLVLAGLAIAVTAQLHLRLAEALIATYDLFPPGLALPAGDFLAWGAGRVASSFALSFGLAMPFVIAALIYNVALGFINRAMPLLMVVLVGAPALTLGGILLLAAVLPIILEVWRAEFAAVLAAPF